MFTDEKMEIEYSKSHDIRAVLKILLDDCFDINNKEKANSTDTVDPNKIKQANNIWKLFASNHKRVNYHGFKEFLIKCLPEKQEYINNILK